MDLTGLLQDAVTTGLPYVPAYIGIWFVFRLQNDFDMTVIGSFALGACVGTQWIVTGHDPLVGLAVSALAGGAAGLLTAMLTHFLKIELVLTGIVVSLGMLSINLLVMPAPTVSLGDQATIYSKWTDLIRPEWFLYADLALSSLIVLLLLLFVNFVLTSEFGLAFRAAGMNANMTQGLGISRTVMFIGSIVAGNLLVGFSGGLVAQQLEYGDVNMGADVILAGITCILLGEVIVRTRRRMIFILVGVVIGTILYRTVLAYALRAGLPPNHFAGASAAIIFILLAVPRIQGRITASAHRRQMGPRDTQDGPAQPRKEEAVSP